MEQYISKDAALVEIENLLKPVRQRLERDKEDPWDSDIAVYEFGKQLTKNINTLEAKEVDLEKETKKWWEEHLHLNPENKLWMDAHQSIVLAKHFFELGMLVSNKAQKGE